MPSNLIPSPTAALLEEILNLQPELISFDVFDTLLWRPCRRPLDVFQRLGEECADKGYVTAIAPPAFASLRVEAERSVRFSGPHVEVTHPEIIAEFCRLLGHSDALLLAREEFRLERESLFAHPEMFELLARLEREGIPFALCSDMYFSAEQIRSFLERAAARIGAVFPEPQAVLVSSEHRTGKSDRLFEILCERTGIPAERILHIGDNPVSDVAKAREKGLRAIHLPRTCPMAETLLDAERNYLHGIGGSVFDFGLATTRKEMLAEALAAHDGKPTHRDYGAFVAGPLLAAFAAWTVLECQRQGIRRVHCLLREGHFLSRLLDRAKAILGVDLEVRTLLASRFCLRAANLVDCSEDDLLVFLRNVRPLDVQANLFEYIGLFEKEDTADWLSQTMDSAEWTDRVACALRVFRENPAARERVSRLASSRKQGLLTYLARQEFFDGQDITMVDLGWGGTIQTCSLPFLRELGFEGAVRGFYLGTDHRIERLDAAVFPWQSLLYRAGEPLDEALIVQRTPELLEQFCMSPHGSLLEFLSNGDPVFHPNRLEAAQIEETRRLQEGVLEFTTRWLPRFLQSGGSEVGAAGLESLSPRLRSILSRSIDAPLPAEVELFCQWRHDSNNGSEDCRPILGDPQTMEDVRFRKITHPSQLDWLRSYWPQGLFTYLGIAWNPGVGGGLTSRMVAFLHRLPGGKTLGTRLLGFWKTLRPRLGMARFRLRIALARWRWRKTGRTARSGK